MRGLSDRVTSPRLALFFFFFFFFFWLARLVDSVQRLSLDVAMRRFLVLSFCKLFFFFFFFSCETKTTTPLLFLISLSFRPRVPPVSEASTTRRTSCAVAAESTRTTFRRPAAPDADTPLPRSAGEKRVEEEGRGVLLNFFFLFSYQWGYKAIRRRTTGTGRMRYLKHIPTRYERFFCFVFCLVVSYVFSSFRQLQEWIS